MHRTRKKALAYSVSLHLLLFALLIFGLPSFLRNEPPPEPAAITVELLPITAVSNVKPEDSEQAEKPKPEEPKKEEQKKPSPPVKVAQATPPPPPPKPEPKPVEKPEVKKPDIKKVEKKPEPKPEPKVEPPKKETPKEKPKKAKEDDLDAILKAVKDTAQQEEKPDKPAEKDVKTSSSHKAISTRFDPNQRMSLSEMDALQSQISKNWSFDAGAKDAQTFIIVIDAKFNSDGSCISAEISSKSRDRYNSDSFYRAAAEAAKRAVWKSSPLKNLSPEKFDAWKEMELTFDSRSLL